MRVEFCRDAYDVSDLDQAKLVTVGVRGLNDEQTRIETHARWVAETQYALEFLTDRLDIDRSTIVLDYGCGTGRVAKALIDHAGCRVIGVDASPSMRMIAGAQVVRSEQFRTCDNVSLQSPLMTGVFDVAVCFWVLQHSADPRNDVQLMHRTLKSGGSLIVWNETARFVPVVGEKFIDDGQDVRAILDQRFDAPIACGRIDPQRVLPDIAARSWWAHYRMS